MNLHKVCRFGIALTIGICLLTGPAGAQEPGPAASTASSTVAARQRDVLLRSVTFVGASLSKPLSDQETRYRLIPTDAREEIRLKSCEAYSSDAKINAVREFDRNENAEVYRVTVTLGGQKAEYFFYFPQTQKDRTAAPDDATLASLSLPQGELSPAFSKKRNSYTLYLPSDVTKLDLTAIPSSGGAMVNAPKEIRLNAGQELKLVISVIAADGVTSTSYTVRIKRIQKTQAEVETLKKDPNFKGLAEQSARKHPALYITLGGTAAAIAIAGGFLWRRKHRKPGK